MEKRKSKKDIVKLLLKKDELGEQDEEELLDLLIEQTIAIDIDKQEEAKLTVGDKLADKVSEVAGSWPFIFIFIGLLRITFQIEMKDFSYYFYLSAHHKEY